MSRRKTTLFIAWVAVIATALSFYFFKRPLVDYEINQLMHLSISWRYVVYLLLGCLRGFTFIPVTYLILLGLVFLPATPAYILTMVGVMVSSTVIYYFAEYLGLSDLFEKVYPKQIARLKNVMKKGELPIVITWSFLPITPTDVMCYVCGSLKIDVKKFWFGVFVGEGVSCAMYIYIGKGLLLFILHKFLGA